MPGILRALGLERTNAIRRGGEHIYALSKTLVAIKKSQLNMYRIHTLEENKYICIFCIIGLYFGVLNSNIDILNKEVDTHNKCVKLSSYLRVNSLIKSIIEEKFVYISNWCR